MYRLLVVDDEDDIREALTSLVDWNAWGYTIVNSFGDAESAIDYIFENPVDVVLTDIRMKEKSGLDIAKFVHQNCPETKVIILSGYKEFEYAKESIDNNVYRYLLKPTDPKELCRVFTELKKQLDATSMVREVDLSYKEQFVHSIIYGNCDIAMTEKYIGDILADFDIKNCRCVVFVFEIKDYSKALLKWKYEKDLFDLAVINFIKAKLESKTRKVCTEIEEEKINTIVFFSEQYENEDLWKKQTIDEICSDFSEMLKIETVPDCNFSYDNIYDMALNFFKDYNSSQNITTVDLKRIIEMKKELISGLFSNSCESNRVILENYINMLCEYGIDMGKMFVNDIFVQIYEMLCGFGISDIEFDFGALVLVHSHEELLNLSLSYIEKAWNIFQKKDVKPQIQLVENAKKYIYENYSKDISLDDVSNAVFVSSTYLSRIFKKMTGVKFIDFLTDVRMKKAKEFLIGSNYKIYDICEMLGYKNPNYFVALFQKKTGMTPLEYRKFNADS